MTIRVLIADDQELVRVGLTMILNAADDIEVVAQAVDGAEAIRLAREVRPDVCLFDIRMPVIDGIEATRELAGPGVVDPLAVVVITTFDHDEYVVAALRAGAKGFLLKDAGATLLAAAVHAAALGDSLIAPQVTVRLLESLVGPTNPSAAMSGVALTDREEQVIVDVAKGMSNREIADARFISLSTVKSHLSSVMGKLGARNRVEIALWAHESGLVTRRNSR